MNAVTHCFSNPIIISEGAMNIMTMFTSFLYGLTILMRLVLGVDLQ